MDSAKVYQLCAEAEKFLYANNGLDSAVKYGELALAMSRLLQFQRGEALSLIRLAQILFKKSENSQVENYNTAALQIGEKLRDDFIIASAYKNKGEYATYISRLNDGIKYYQNALDIKFEKEQSLATADTYTKIGFTCLVLGEFDKQMEWQTRALKLFEKLNDQKGIAATKDNLAELFLELGKNKEAIEYAKQATTIREQLNNYEELSQSYNNLSQIYLFSDSSRQADYYGALGLKYAERSGIPNRIAHAYTTQTLLKNRTRKNNEALVFEKKAIAILEQTGDDIMLSRRYISAAILSQSKEVADSAGAVYYYQKAIVLATKINARMNLRDVFFFRSKFYRDHKDFENAYADYGRHIIYRDSLINEETKSKIADIETKYETEKKDNEIKRLYTEQRIKQLEAEKREKTQKNIKNKLAIGFILVLLIGAISFNRYQLKKKLEQQKSLLAMRNNISQDLHDDIGASLSNINILNELAQRNISQPERAKEYLTKASEDIQRISESLSDIVWNINPRYDELQNLFIRMRRYAADMLDGKNINGQFDFPADGVNLKLSMTQRRDLYLIFKEAVNNLAKYSQARNAVIRVTTTSNAISLLIKDDGKGFERKTAAMGNGLQNMEQRAKASGDHLSVQSKPGEGTTISLEMKVD